MKPVLSGVVAVVLIVSSSGAGPEEDRAPRATQDQTNVEKRLGELEAKVRTHQQTLDQLARMQGPYLFVSPEDQPWFAPTPHRDVFPVPYFIPVPHPTTAAIGPGTFDRCLITVDGASFDSHFVVNLPALDSRMIVALRVTGLPAGSLSYRLFRP